MASAFTHAFAGVMAGKFSSGEPRPWKAWAYLLILPALPDLDVIFHHMGFAHESIWNHRGITHSLFFALLLALAAKALWFKEQSWNSRKAWGWIALLFFAVASHGFLDSMTDGGGGVAFFAPFDSTRYFFPWRPLKVSPLSVKRFFEGRAPAVLWSEFKVVWAPLLLAWFALWAWRRRERVRR